uniref:CYCLIN domain-containing protein n=1 Tax=Bursaphelenchus xylophilus TaxID=6326 RepID=A0A1I7S7J0_BURXY
MFISESVGSTWGCSWKRMGNICKCFKRKQNDHKKHKNLHNSFRGQNHQTLPGGREVSVNKIPHIIDRELPDDDEFDPSTHPTAPPTFIERSQSGINIKTNRYSSYFLDQINERRTGLKRWNSCSTIYLDDSTISQPHLKNTVLCMSFAVYYHILNRGHRGHERLMEIFEERLHPIAVRDSLLSENPNEDPTQKSIYKFVRLLFQAAQLTAECAIITLVYIERLLNYAEIDLCPSNWRRIVLGAIMLASKVWDDQAVWNVDFCQILHNANIDDMNELERQFLECLEFNINVQCSVYAKYYYDLRSLAIANDIPLPTKPLSKERASKLEATSQAYEEKKLNEKTTKLKRSFSMERHVGNSKVVIS